ARRPRLPPLFFPIQSMAIHVKASDLAAYKASVGIVDVKPKRHREDREHRHQVAVFQWRAAKVRQFPFLARMYAVPNGGSRNAMEAASLKAEGLLPGVSDIVLPRPLRGYHGLYIELKDLGRESEKDGGLSPAQLTFLQGVSEDGHFSAVAYGSNQAIDILEWYIGITDTFPDVRFF
ncbi:MAG: hypothetical protein ABI977_16520, partial [Acidobacteriota bacterium]